MLHSDAPSRADLPAPLPDVGLTAEAVLEVEHLLVGCGGFVRELISFTAGSSVRKGDSGERLSAADALVDRLLREQLLRLFPGSCGYSEEAGEFGTRTGGLRIRWLIDPVDGTRPALLGGAFAVSLGGLVLDGDRPLAAVGWVYVPNLAALYRGVVATAGESCLLNGTPAEPERGLTPSDLSTRYLAVGSDWRTTDLPHSPLKLSAPGATAVHLCQLVQPGSDVVAAVLSRYRAYDAAGGLPVALGAGCRLYRVDPEAVSPLLPLDPLTFLAEAYASPAERGPQVLVCTPEVAAHLSASSGSGTSR